MLIYIEILNNIIKNYIYTRLINYQTKFYNHYLNKNKKLAFFFLLIVNQLILFLI